MVATAMAMIKTIDWGFMIVVLMRETSLGIDKAVTVDVLTEQTG